MISRRYVYILACVAVVVIGLLLATYNYSNMKRSNPSHIPAPLATQSVIAATTQDGKPYQYVVLAFDGSRSLEEWRETLDFAKSMNESGTPIHFTYFINAIYLLTESNKNIYHPPKSPIGTSLIGYGSTSKEIGKRTALINEAYQSGHEIGSHGVGHTPGYRWSIHDWKGEFTQFNMILDRARAGIDTDVALAVPATAIEGFRAPNLVVSNGLDSALDMFGFTYDASRISTIGVWPHKIAQHWEMPLVSIPYDGKREILSMDYNFYVADSHAKDVLKKDTALWQKKHDKMLAAYINYFNMSYNSTRVPIFIGHHFSDWNDGLYWDVMKEAIKTICSKPKVRCTTYKDTLRYLQAR